MEKQHPYNPEELITNYTHELAQVLNDREIGLQTFHTNYQGVFDKFNPGGVQAINNLLAGAANHIEESLNDASNNLWDMAESVSNMLLPHLSDREVSTLGNIHDVIKQTEHDPKHVKRLLSQSSQRVRVVLDSELMWQLSNAVDEVSITDSGIMDNPKINQILSFASGPVSFSAMEAYIDRAILDELSGVMELNNDNLKEILDLAELSSTVNAQNAIRDSMDLQIFRNLRNVAYNSPQFNQLLGSTSSSSVRHAFMNALKGYSDEGSQKNSESGYFKYDNYTQGVVDAAITRDPQRSWLRSEDPAAVFRVINTVRRLRKNNPGITDRDIYLKYRSSIEEGMVNSNSSADPRLVKSFQIFDALMGGHKGSLLF